MRRYFFTFRTRPRRAAFLAAGLLLTVSAGCELMQKCGCGGAPEPPKPISRLDSLWQQEVVFTPNTHDGKPLPGIFGRVWLYRDGIKAPVEADGVLEIAMFDLTPTAQPGGKAAHLASWRFNPRELSQLKRGDMVGTGYSLFLPIEAYRPEVKQVQIQMAFVAEKGPRVTTAPEILVLRTDARSLQMKTEQRPIVPVSMK